MGDDEILYEPIPRKVPSNGLYVQRSRFVPVKKFVDGYRLEAPRVSYDWRDQWLPLRIKVYWPSSLVNLYMHGIAKVNLLQ